MTFPSLDLACELAERARLKGADAADVVCVGSTSLGVSVRNGVTEELERSETTDLGLRVFIGKQSAIVSTSTLDTARFDALVEQALAMAQVLPADANAGLPEAVPLIGRLTDNQLDLVDTAEPDAAQLLDRARRTEDAARAIQGVSNSAGASATWGRSSVALASSAGVAGYYARTRHSVSMSALAGEGTGMQRDWDFHSTVHLSDLEDGAVIGAQAGRNAVARLKPTQPRTGVMPAVYAPRVANGLLGHLSGAINGIAIARGTSFLKEKMGQRVFPSGIRVIDDPRRVRGLRSKPFDGEGIAGQPLELVADGVLQDWLLDCRSARQLGLTTNGRASRGTSSPPSPGASNLYFAAGDISPEALIADIAEGVYLTEMMGSAVNGITGDYSRGASGFMIRNGQLAEPIAEFTVAGNLLDMFGRLQVASDLTFRFGSDSPTIRIDGMSIAGN
ncbi:TldD/PmbA family protein [Acetobacter conturbans]|uniref:TldD/PmbA family protein n=1 Tax=Acetobacter conturbans TaxID=1737472 RepID=A0ABX0K234_9PROT|nr:TldD/PmbA family protein [Acetobacter conturbans]NHN88881.1 TldD/PmbA family protein [Acetobacter conturbans]